MNDEEEFLASLREEFVVVAVDQLDVCEGHLLAYERSNDAADLTALKRCVHSLKGSAQAVGMMDFASLLHVFESKLDAFMKCGRMRDFVNFALPFIDGLKKPLQLTGDACRGEIAQLNDSVEKLKA